MRKIPIFLALMTFCFSLGACNYQLPPSNTNEEVEALETDDDFESQYTIYLYAKAAGYPGTYDEWIASIKGDKGATGPKGDTGAKGNKGADGSTLYSGKGSPSNSLGKDGDCYVDLSTYNFYVKTSGAWSYKVNLLSPTVVSSQDVSVVELYHKSQIKREYVGKATTSISAKVTAKQGCDTLEWFTTNNDLISFSVDGKKCNLTINNVSSYSEVIVGVKSIWDANFFDMVTFKLYPVGIADYSYAFDNSGNPVNIDQSAIDNDGRIVVNNAQRSCIGFKDLNADIWYVQADITVTKQINGDAWPKIGIMTGSYNGDITADSLWYYVDCATNRSSPTKCWNYMTAIERKDDASDWNFDIDHLAGYHYGNDACHYKLNCKMRIGLLRYNNYYFCFNDMMGGFGSVMNFSHTKLVNNSSAWIFCYNQDYVINHMIVKRGNEAIKMATKNVGNELSCKDVGTVFTGKDFYVKTQLGYRDHTRELAEPIFEAFDSGLVRYKSSNNNIVEFDNNLKRFKAKAPGDATITISYPGCNDVVSKVHVQNEFPVEGSGTKQNRRILVSKKAENFRNYTATIEGEFKSNDPEFYHTLGLDLLIEGKYNVYDGGVFLRGDWWGEGAWMPQPLPISTEGDLGRYADIKSDCTFSILIVWRVNEGSFYVELITRSKNTGEVVKVKMSLFGINYRGILDINAGITESNNGQWIKFNSCVVNYD